MKLQQFAEKWTHADDTPERVSEEALSAAEQLLGVRLPDDYRQNILQAGLPRPTIALLDAIVENRLHLADIASFFPPSDIVDRTLTWREINLPEHLIAFASDCMGNMFCFDAARVKAGAPDAASIWFFDHDTGDVEAVASGFDVWIAAYCDVEPWPGTEIG